MTELKTNIRGLKINPEKITGITCLMILTVILFRFTVFAFGIPNPIIGGINLGLVLLSFIIILITDGSILSLLLIPLVCAITVFINSAVHNFEFHRGVIFNTFLAQLFLMYIFANLNRKYSEWTINIIKYYTVFMASAGLIFTIFGIHYIFGLRVSTAAEYGFRTTSIFFSNGAYMGYFATFILAVILLSEKYNMKNLIVGILLFTMLILSSNRTALFGLMLIIFLYIVYSRKISVPYKFFSLFLFLLLTGVFLLIWYSSLYNFKTADSGRLFLIAKSLKLVKEGFFFGADNFLIDSKTHIAQIHNMYLAVIGEFGIFVLMGQLWYLGWFFKKSGKRGRIILTYLFIYCLFHPGFYVGFSENFFLFLLVVIYLNHYEKEESENSSLITTENN